MSKGCTFELLPEKSGRSLDALPADVVKSWDEAISRDDIVLTLSLKSSILEIWVKGDRHRRWEGPRSRRPDDRVNFLAL